MRCSPPVSPPCRLFSAASTWRPPGWPVSCSSEGAPDGVLRLARALQTVWRTPELCVRVELVQATPNLTSEHQPLVAAHKPPGGGDLEGPDRVHLPHPSRSCCSEEKGPVRHKVATAVGNSIAHSPSGPLGPPRVTDGQVWLTSVHPPSLPPSPECGVEGCSSRSLSLSSGTAFRGFSVTPARHSLSCDSPSVHWLSRLLSSRRIASFITGGWLVLATSQSRQRLLDPQSPCSLFSS